MTRPEALALVPVAVLVAYLRHRRRGEALQVLAWFLGIYGAYFGVRWWHFGYLFPNTFYAKLDFGGQEFWQRGALYVWDFLRASPFVTLLAVVAMGKAWRAPLWVKAWSLVVMAQVLIVVYEGGDHFAMFRFLVLAVPFLGMLALQLPVEFIRRRGWSSSVKATALSVCLALLFVSGLRMGRQQKRYEPPGVRQFARFKLESQMARDWAVMGRWLHGNAPNEASLSTIAIGAIGFFSDLTILDPYGLTDPEIAHKESDLGSGYAGHEKFDIESIFLQRPTYLLLANQLTAAPIPEEDLPRWSWGAFNKAMVADPRLRQSYRYEPVEIGTHQWMNLHLLREE